MSSSSSPSEPDSESDAVVRYMRGTTCSRSFAAHAPGLNLCMLVCYRPLAAFYAAAGIRVVTLLLIRSATSISLCQHL